MTTTHRESTSAAPGSGLVPLERDKIAQYRSYDYPDEVLPLQPDQRTWGTFNYVTLWMGAVHNIMSYMTVAGFYVLGLDTLQVLAAVMISAVIVSIGYVLNGHSAARYGLPFAMLLRDTFGVKGSVFPALARGLIAGVVFFGTTTVVGAQAFNVMFERMFPGYTRLGGDFNLLGLDLPTLLSYVLLWTITVALFLGGMKILGVFGRWSSPLIYVLIIVAAGWAISLTGVGPVLDYQPEHTMDSPLVFIACVSALVSNWAGPIVNISDLTRNAKSVKAPAIGLPAGMLVSYVLFAITTVSLIAAVKIQFGETVFNPVDAFAHMENDLVVILLILALNTGATAFVVFANLLPSGLQMTALMPRLFNVKTAGVMTAVVGTLIMPWKLVDSTDTLFLFYSFIGSMFGPIAGIMLAGYYLECRRRINLDNIYVAPGADGGYPGGVNKAAVCILALSFVCTMTGAFVKSVPLFVELNNFAFFAGLTISFVLYTATVKLRTPTRA